MRDLVRLIQDQRKEMGCEFTDRIEIGVVTESSELRTAIQDFEEMVQAETLAVRIVPEPLSDSTPRASNFGEISAKIYVQVVCEELRG